MTDKEKALELVRLHEIYKQLLKALEQSQKMSQEIKKQIYRTKKKIQELL